MASRIMHLAVAYVLAENCETGSRERFLAGAVIPDALPKQQGHFWKFFDEDRYKTYDLAGFRQRYSDRLGDGLYIGYYMHLVMDLVFRDHLYHGIGYVPTDEKTAQLHKDYSIINGYICPKFGISKLPELPDSLDTEPIIAGHGDAVRAFFADMRRDLTERPQGSPVYYTEKIADEYINRAVGVCKREVAALCGKGKHIDELSFSWLRHK